MFGEIPQVILQDGLDKLDVHDVEIRRMSKGEKELKKEIKILQDKVNEASDNSKIKELEAKIENLSKIIDDLQNKLAFSTSINKSQE